MNLIFDCYPCILRQVLSTAKLCGLNKNQTGQVVDFTLRELLKTTMEDSPQRQIVHANDFIHTVCFPDKKEYDPYRQLKRQSNEVVIDRFDSLEKMIVEAPHPLETAITFAAAGNIIDFGANEHADIDIEKEIRNIPSLRFSRYDYIPFAELLDTSKTLLYIGDNAGEIVFDRLFIREIKRTYPEKRIVFTTRSKAIINDVTLEDAYMVGIDTEAEVISSGCRYPGIVLTETSEQFGMIYNSADLIIAKGQGNLEGLSEVNDGRIFLILRIKCERVAESVGAAVGDLIFLRKTDSF
jgi:damage-control phosphatase, subfamily I